MFGLDFPVALLLLFGLLQGRQLALGEDEALLGHLGFQCFYRLLEGLPGRGAATPSGPPPGEMMIPSLRSSLASLSCA